MQEDIITLPPSYKLYNDRAIYIGTILGGPLVAGYIAAENFKQLGQRSSVRTAWIVAIASTVVIFGLIFLVPAIQDLPRWVVPLVYTGIAQVLIQRYQGQAIKKHLAEGGQLYSLWRAALVGLIGLVILVAIIYVVLFIGLGDLVTA